MRKRYLYGSGIALMAILITLLVWQVSFTFGEFGPVTAVQTSVFWAVSTLIFLLTVTLGFMLFRTGVKLYIQRQADREGSRIQTKLVAGALALSLLPVVFLVMFSYVILNRNVEKWFSRPAEGVRTNLVDVNRALSMEVRGRADSLAQWLASRADVQSETADFAAICRDFRIAGLEIAAPDGSTHAVCSMASGPADVYTARAKMVSGKTGAGELLVTVRPSADLLKTQHEIDRYMNEYGQLAAQKRNIRTLYLLFILAIALFILFVATWIALLLARQISSPISALLMAAGEVRRGNLSHRVKIRAVDELATLVRAFNEMMQELEANSRELESRRRFTEAILESIPTGVISLSSEGRIQRVNRALHGLFPAEQVMQAIHLRDLFPPEDTTEIEYLMKRARRTGVAASQIDIPSPGQVLHLAVTVSALPAQSPNGPGFVVVLDDTSELLRAQKAAAWHEVARRIAHELKNPLTPIALSAERIGRILDRGPVTPDSRRVLYECARTISREVESVKMLADEFSRFSRFPAAKPVPCDLNEIVRDAIAHFLGRLEGIDLRVDLAPDVPLVNLDPEQFKRVVVNLVDNAAEAMRDSLLKQLLVRTRPISAESIELLVADTGCGISAADKEKLFLPYFSTKERGTGLGLAIVSHILSEHGARVRVEDNPPSGARFYLEIPVAVAAEMEIRA